MEHLLGKDQKSKVKMLKNRKDGELKNMYSFFIHSLSSALGQGS
jgi:hypothetical protein